jgi:hypothetical protein
MAKISVGGGYVDGDFKGRLKRAYTDRCRRIAWVVIALIVSIFVILTLLRIRSESESSNLSPLAFSVRPGKSESICKPYTPLYTDAIATHRYYLERGGIQTSDLAAAKAHCDAHGQCIQIKIYDMNIFVGNVSSNPRCYETRGESLVMNLDMAVEQARAEGEILPNVDVYLQCHDRPDAGAHAMWYISKTVDHVNAEQGQDNFFLMPDFNFYSWPEAFNEPWTYVMHDFANV